MILDYALFCYRVAPAERTKMTSFELVYWRSPYLGIEYVISNEKEFGSSGLRRETIDELIKQRNKHIKHILHIRISSDIPKSTLKKMILCYTTQEICQGSLN